MAGASDPLEDMLFSEVDEKAVSDLVGSLESQLVGRSGNKAGGAKQHLVGKSLASRASTPSEQQQQQQHHHHHYQHHHHHHHHHHHLQQHKAGTERGSDSGESTAAATESGVKATAAPSPGSVETSRHYGTRKKRGGGARGSAAARNLNGAATCGSGVASPPSSAAAAVSMATARANPTTYTVSGASGSVALDKGTPTIALQRLPSHIVASIAQGRNGTSVSALIQQGSENHGKKAEIDQDKTKADVQQLQPGSPQLQPQPRPAAPLQRITAPQLIVRPPQQQATIQLPPGFTIPAG
ncbi:transcription initiation factor TFIID subunit 4-like, partial [Silurus asotus]